MNNPAMSRRSVLQSAVLSSTALLAGGSVSAGGDSMVDAGAIKRRGRPHVDGGSKLELNFSVKYGMIGAGGRVAEKFALLKKLGYDGAELDSPSNLNREEVLEASRSTGVPIHGVVDSVHWSTRLSDPDAAVREKGRLALEGAIRDSKAYGGSSVLLVPGVAHKNETENHDQVWERSIEQIRFVLPLAARLGVHILIENVWNNFLYDPDGGAAQTPDRAIAYIDEINSPWVGVYFDIGNIQRYGDPAQWIRGLGHRIVKLDVKDWGKENGFCKIGDGDVDWAQVRQALRDIGFTGWATAEVGGGDEARLAEIKSNMDKTLRS